jgi:hypothetical protein
MTKLNRNLSIQQKTEWWDKRLDKLIYLVTVENYRLKDLSKYFDRKVGTISAMLYRRGLSILQFRHQYKKQQKATQGQKQ